MSITIAKEKYPAYTAGAGVSGKRLVMFVNYGAGATPQNPVWTLLGGCTSNNLALSAEASSQQTKDTGYWPITTITSKSFEVSADVIMERDNEAQEAVEAFMLDDEITAEKKLLNIAIVDLDTLEYYDLTVAPTSWDITAESEDMITKTLAATGSGAPEKKTGFVVPDVSHTLPPITYSQATEADVVLTVPAGTITKLQKGGVDVTDTNYSIAVGGQSIIILGTYLTTLSTGDATFTVVLDGGATYDCVITIAA